MRRAIGPASTALEQKGQKLGGLRYMSSDVKQLYGVAQLESLPIAAETVEVLEAVAGESFRQTKRHRRHPHRRQGHRRSRLPPRFSVRFRFSE